MRSRGFTLVEILVGLAILAFTSAIIVFNAAPPRDAAQDDADRFAAKLQLAREQAILQGAPIEVEINASGYRFLSYDGEEWREIAAPGLAPERFRAAVVIDTAGVDPSLANERFLNTAGLPQEEQSTFRVPIDPIGAAAPLIVQFTGGRGAMVALSENGDLSVIRGPS